MENLAYTSVLWPTERLGRKNVARMHKVGIVTTILAQLIKLAKKIDVLATN